MLEINGIKRFYFIPQFHDMRCKYDRVLSIIREQFLREPEQDEVFIFMSKDRRKIRLFNYDRRSASLYEKRLSPHYKFMKVEWNLCPRLSSRTKTATRKNRVVRKNALIWRGRPTAVLMLTGNS